MKKIKLKIFCSWKFWSLTNFTLEKFLLMRIFNHSLFLSFYSVSTFTLSVLLLPLYFYSLSTFTPPLLCVPLYFYSLSLSTLNSLFYNRNTWTLFLNFDFPSVYSFIRIHNHSPLFWRLQMLSNFMQDPIVFGTKDFLRKFRQYISRSQKLIFRIL